MKQLILGGARSGKSSLAEQLASDLANGNMPNAVGYIATANREYNDDEMNVRIVHHRQQRPSEWPTYEAPIKLSNTILQASNECNLLLVDCLTLWLTNLLMAGEETFEQEKSALLKILANTSTPIIMVSNEVGLGIVPLDKLSRRFVDEAGRLHQEIAKLCDRVIFTAAGLPMVMKGPSLTNDQPFSSYSKT